MNERQRGLRGAYPHLLILSALALGGCGAASSMATAAVKSRIDSQCGGVGLKGCPDLADGAIAYISGNDAEAEAKLRSAAAKNSPEQLRHFTKALTPILEAADADAAKKLRGVIAILEGKTSAPDEGAPAEPAAKTAQASPARSPKAGPHRTARRV